MPALMLVAAILVGGAFGVFHVSRRVGTSSAILTLAWCVLVGRFLVGIALLQFQGLTASDAYGYHLAAIDIAKYLLGDGMAPALTPGKEGWIWILGVSYAISGPSAFIGIAINAVASALTVILTAGTAQNIAPSSRAAPVAAVLIALAPGYWFWGSIPLREATVALTCALIAYAVTKARPSWPLIVTGLVALVWLRGGSAVLVGAALAVAMILPAKQGAGDKPRVTPALRVIVSLGALVFAQIAYRQLEHETTADRIAAIRSAQGNAASGFGPVEGDSPFMAGLTSLPHVLVGPYPWEVPAVPGLLPMALSWWFIVGMLLFRRRHLKRVPGLWTLLLPALALLWALAVYSGNYGTMIRLREQTLPFLVPLVAVVLVRARSVVKPESTGARSGKR